MNQQPNPNQRPIQAIEIKTTFDNLPSHACSHGWVPGGTFFGTPWNPMIAVIVGFWGVPKTEPLEPIRPTSLRPMIQNPMISRSGLAGPLRFGVQTPSKPHDRCDRGVLGGTEKRTPWNPSVPVIVGFCGAGRLALVLEGASCKSLPSETARCL